MATAKKTTAAKKTNAEKTPAKKAPAKRTAKKPISKKTAPKAAPKATAKKAVPTASSTAQTKATPTSKAQPGWQRFTWLVFPILLISIVLAGLWWQQEQQGARQSLEEIQWAISQQNIEHFERYVDMDAVANSIVAQVLPTTTEEPTGLLNRLQSGVRNRLNRFIAPELSSGLANSLRLMIQNGPSSAYHNGTPVNLLERLLLDLAGPSTTGEIAEWPTLIINKIEEREENSIATIIWRRADLPDVPLELKLMLQEEENGMIQLQAIEGLDAALQSLQQAQLEALQTQNEAIKTQMAKQISASVVAKSSGLSKWGVGQGVMIQTAIANIGEQTISAAKLKLTFSTSQSVVLNSYPLSLQQQLASGTELTQSFPITINPLSVTDSQVFELPLEQLQTKIEATSIDFADGSRLEQLAF